MASLVAVIYLTIQAAAPPNALASEAPEYPKRRPSIDPIWVGEKQEFSVSFLGFTGLHVELEVLPYDQIAGRKTYHTRASLKNSLLLGLFYDLDDTAETWIDFEGLFSHRFHLVQHESKLQREAWEEHDPIKGETTYRNDSRRKGENREQTRSVSPIPRFGQDTFSSFYFLRGLPLEIGDAYRIPVISEGNSIEVLASVQGVDLLSVLGKKMQALQIKLEKLDPRGNPIPSQSNLVWLSNDERRLLLRVNVTTRFGHIVGELKDYSPGNSP